MLPPGGSNARTGSRLAVARIQPGFGGSYGQDAGAGTGTQCPHDNFPDAEVWAPSRRPIGMREWLTFRSSRVLAADDRMPMWIAVFLAILALVTRAQILGDALADSDEGFYLLAGERMLRGALLYVDIWDRKPAGLFLLYAGMRRLGGDGVLAYQLVGTLVAFLTALLITHAARRFSGTFGAVAAGAAYLLWLPLGSAAGGQAELFCNLPMTAAAVITLRGLEQPAPARLWPGGVTAMLLVGIAMQIKYTALFAGVFLGCCWLRAAWRSRRATALLLPGAVWVLAALAPTLLIAAWYAAHGHLDDFLYANFISALQRGSSALPERACDLGILLLILAPLFACIRLRLKPGAAGAVAHRFTLGWLAAATAGMVAFGTYFLQFLLPVLMPASLAAAPTLDRISRRSAVLLLGAAFLLGQAGLWIAHEVHGSNREARNIVARVDATRCLYIYSGVAALYRLADTCIATRYAFPS